MELELRRELATLSERVSKSNERLLALELQTVKRNGPIIDELRQTERELRATERALDKLTDQMASRDEIQRALSAQTRELAGRRDSAFSHRQKLLGAVFAAVIVGLNVVQTLHGIGL